MVTLKTEALQGNHSNHFTFEHYNVFSDQDLRTRLLSIGYDRADGRYTAFLDYDDLWYDDALQKLIRLLEYTDAAIGFGTVNIVHYRQSGEEIIPLSTDQYPVRARCKMDLIRISCQPIHSFLIDRLKIHQNICFDTAVRRKEDYFFLLQIIAKSKCSFLDKDDVLGEYWIDIDNKCNYYGIEWNESSRLINEKICDMVFSFTGSELLEGQLLDDATSELFVSLARIPNIKSGFGSVDEVEIFGDRQIIRGWAMRSDLSPPVHIFIVQHKGKRVLAVKTGINRFDVARSKGSDKKRFGFSALVDLTPFDVFFLDKDGVVKVDAKASRSSRQNEPWKRLQLFLKKICGSFFIAR
jgi:glycosyltransferase involved in cell wall biosynthesis